MSFLDDMAGASLEVPHSAGSATLFEAQDANGLLFEGASGGESPALPAAPMSEGAALAAPSSFSGAGLEAGKHSSAPSLFATPTPSVNDGALRAWRTAHNEKLKTLAADAQRRTDEELARAKQELDKMTAEWEAKKKKQHEKNAADEKKFLAERDAAGASHGWTNVARYVDLKGLENSGGEKDVVRMREVLARSLQRK